MSEVRSMNDVMADYFHREFAHLYGAEAVAPAGGDGGYLMPEVPLDDVAIDATKLTGYIAVSNEMLMDCGVIPDTRPRPVISRRERFRRWRRGKISDLRMAVAERVYRFISGEDVPEPEDWR